MSREDKEAAAARDRLVEDYGTVLRESAVLTTFAGILFGFLLEISINLPDSFSLTERVSLLVALFSITIAVSLLVFAIV